jgi:hypothetical protein
MVLPNSETAYVPIEKLTQYLLSPLHSVGKHKTRVLRSVGFDETNIALLENELLRLAKNENVLQMIETNYGMKYVLDGTISTPKGTTLNLKTIWIIEHGKTSPRFVTLYPI